MKVALIIMCVVAGLMMGCSEKEIDTSGFRFETQIRDTSYYTQERPVSADGFYCFKEGIAITRKYSAHNEEFADFCTNDRNGKDSVWIKDRGE